MKKEAISRQVLNAAFANRMKRVKLWDAIADSKGITGEDKAYFVAKGMRSEPTEGAVEKVRGFLKVLRDKEKHPVTNVRGETTLVTPVRPRGMSETTKNIFEHLLNRKTLPEDMTFMQGGKTKVIPKDHYKRLPSHLLTGQGKYKGVTRNIPSPDPSKSPIDISYDIPGSADGLYNKPYFGVGTLSPSKLPGELKDINIDTGGPLNQQLARGMSPSMISGIKKDIDMENQIAKFTGAPNTSAVFKPYVDKVKGLKVTPGLDRFKSVMRQMPDDTAVFTEPAHYDVNNIYQAALGFAPVSSRYLAAPGGAGKLTAADKLNQLIGSAHFYPEKLDNPATRKLFNELDPSGKTSVQELLSTPPGRLTALERIKELQRASQLEPRVNLLKSRKAIDDAVIPFGLLREPFTRLKGETYPIEPIWQKPIYKDVADKYIDYTTRNKAFTDRSYQPITSPLVNLLSGIERHGVD
jgi:hypothetical protein